jgi:hypothetical protein
MNVWALLKDFFFLTANIIYINNRFLYKTNKNRKKMELQNQGAIYKRNTNKENQNKNHLIEVYF